MGSRGQASGDHGDGRGRVELDGGLRHAPDHRTLPVLRDDAAARYFRQWRKFDDASAQEWLTQNWSTLAPSTQQRLTRLAGGPRHQGVVARVQNALNKRYETYGALAETVQLLRSASQKADAQKVQIALDELDAGLREIGHIRSRGPALRRGERGADGFHRVEGQDGDQVLHAEALAGAHDGRHRLLRIDGRVEQLDAFLAEIAVAAGFRRLAEIGEQRLPPAARRLRERQQRTETLTLDALALVRGIALLDLQAAQLTYCWRARRWSPG